MAVRPINKRTEGTIIVDGIHPPFEAFYIESMLWHTSSAQRSIGVLNKWLKQVRNEDKQALEFPKRELFEELQNILHQGGCLSRYFFPAREKPVHTGRAQRLRQALEVKDDSPLAERELRNAIEHFDERLDTYLLENHVGEFIPQDVGYVMPNSEIPLHVFKGFYAQPLIFALLGTRYEMAPIVNELLRIHNALCRCTESDYRLPYLTKEQTSP